MKQIRILALSLCAMALLSCTNQNQNDSKNGTNNLIQQLVDNSNPKINKWIANANKETSAYSGGDLVFLEALNLGADGLWIKYESKEEQRTMSDIKTLGVDEGQDYWGMMLDSWSSEEDFWKMVMDEKVPQVVMAIKGTKSGEIVHVAYSQKAISQIFSYLQK